MVILNPLTCIRGLLVLFRDNRLTSFFFLVQKEPFFFLSFPQTKKYIFTFADNGYYCAESLVNLKTIELWWCGCCQAGLTMYSLVLKEVKYEIVGARSWPPPWATPSPACCASRSRSCFAICRQSAELSCIDASSANEKKTLVFCERLNLIPMCE